jgi:hypothetical protein
MSIRALVVDPEAIDGMRLTDVPEPGVDPDQVGSTFTTSR